jgi:hypothetical protein
MVKTKSNEDEIKYKYYMNVSRKIAVEAETQFYIELFDLKIIT